MEFAPKNQRKKFGKGEILQQAPLQPVTALSSCLERMQHSWKRDLVGIWRDWEKLVGPQLANNSRPLTIRQEILSIGATHPQWRQALLYNRPQLLARIKAAGYAIRDLRIKQYHPYKIQEKENESSIWARHPSRIDVHGMAICEYCLSPAPAGEMGLWGKCSFCRRKQFALKSEATEL